MASACSSAGAGTGVGSPDGSANGGTGSITALGGNAGAAGIATGGAAGSALGGSGGFSSGGTAGGTAGAGGQTDSGAPKQATKLAELVGTWRGPVLDENHVYVGKYSTVEIRRVPKTGGNVETISTGLSQLYAFGQSGNRLFILTVTSIEGPGSIWSIDKSGANLVKLADGVGMESMYVGATRVYWSEYDAIKSISVDGGTVTTLSAKKSSNPVHAMTGDSERVYWTMGGGIYSVPLSGGTAAKHDTTGINGGTIPTMAVDPTMIFAASYGSLYCTSPADLGAVPIAGGTMKIVATFGHWGGQIAAEPGALYAVDACTGVVSKTTTAGVKTPLFTVKPSKSSGVALDANAVFVVTEGELWRLEK